MLGAGGHGGQPHGRAEDVVCHHVQHRAEPRGPDRQIHKQKIVSHGYYGSLGGGVSRDSLAELASDVAIKEVQQGRHQVEEEHPYPETGPG